MMSFVRFRPASLILSEKKDMLMMWRKHKTVSEGRAIQTERRLRSRAEKDVSISRIVCLRPVNCMLRERELEQS